MNRQSDLAEVGQAVHSSRRLSRSRFLIHSRFTVQSKDSTTVRIPIDFTYAGIGAASTQMMQQGSVPYTITGDVTVGTPLGNFTRPYTGTGRFSAFGGAQNSR